MTEKQVREITVNAAATDPSSPRPRQTTSPETPMKPLSHVRPFEYRSFIERTKLFPPERISTPPNWSGGPVVPPPILPNDAVSREAKKNQQAIPSDFALFERPGRFDPGRPGWTAVKPNFWGQPVARIRQRISEDKAERRAAEWVVGKFGGELADWEQTLNARPLSADLWGWCLTSLVCDGVSGGTIADWQPEPETAPAWPLPQLHRVVYAPRGVGNLVMDRLDMTIVALEPQCVGSPHFLVPNSSIDPTSVIRAYASLGYRPPLEAALSVTSATAGTTPEVRKLVNGACRAAGKILDRQARRFGPGISE